MTIHRLAPDNVDWRPVEGELVALDRRTSQYLALNRTGTVLWQALLDGATTEQLVDLVTEQFTVSPEAARHDVEVFLQDLADRGLLVT